MTRTTCNNTNARVPKARMMVVSMVSDGWVDQETSEKTVRKERLPAITMAS